MTTNLPPKKDILTIHAKEWFDRTYGNSYFSAYATINGEFACKIPYEYGYGEHYKECVHRELIKLGILDKDHPLEPLWQACNRLNITLIADKVSVSRKKDL